MDAGALDPNSYTAQRLQHATPEHLYLTSRRCFIGPIPEGWLKSHRHDWYKHHLHINYSSRAATFSTDLRITHDRRTSGIDGPRTSRPFRPSFPQPADLDEDDHAHANGDGAADTGAIVVVPRASEPDPEIVDEELAGRHRRAQSRSSTAKSRVEKLRRPDYKRDNTGSYVTAREEIRPPSIQEPRAISVAESSLQIPSSPRVDGSTSSLLPKAHTAAPEPVLTQPEEASNTRQDSGRALVKFDLPEDSMKAEIQAKAQLARTHLGRKGRRLKKTKLRDGQIVKMDKMLVRVDTTISEVGEEFDENEAHKIESRTSEKWREYMVVCRDNHEADEDFPFVLQMYKSRVIAAVEGSKNKKKAKHEVRLGPKYTRVNLYSSLDKTVVIWTPYRKGTKIYIMRPRSGSSAAEWYTFLRNVLGWNRASELQVNVPDLDVSLRLENPFQELESSKELQEAAKGNEEAMVKAVQQEQAVAKNIINRAIEMLSQTQEYSEVVKKWTSSERIGLAWKRYDRLEWIHGPNEKKMYGSIAMARTHELELRPKEHYPTKARTKKNNIIEEPVPVEGFLIRLTSQRGLDQRLGPKAVPPPPPKLPCIGSSRLPTPKEITDAIPLVYAVNPYPVKDGEIEWLAGGDGGSSENIRYRDRDAEDEAERKTNLLLKCDGYINLCNIKKVRKVHRGASAADENMDEGSDVDFDLDVDDSMEDDGITHEFDDERTFELVLRNGLIIRLQAFDKMTKKEWMHRLRKLVKYWKYRTATDIQLYKTIRKYNLELLKIDEEAEAIVGQFARKWEVLHAHASSELYNMCGISACRSIHISGVLFRKPRRHATFTRCSVILSAGTLLIFQDSVRKSTGKQLAHIHHEHISTLDLRDCYLYSGLLTEADLLYQNRTFDNNRPGHTALPRIYLEDGWTSTDEDYMTCFALWHGRKKSLFRRGHGDDEVQREVFEKEGGRRSRWKLVSQLGVPGNTMVFKARSRAERDHWVLAIQTECERLAQAEEVRIVESA
ncbi:Sporulation-specific protein 71 [Lasiodiplodia theobromae]|uniref:Sporulation-specific protein 71 n=1 Tax=Lasiodiplodia theobromae TaxID=45133 RepID=A0A5N5D5J0_9PEZI|nr:Sporulation-specific protein 71 [Lasiodiplodia theobromae]